MRFLHVRALVCPVLTERRSRTWTGCPGRVSDPDGRGEALQGTGPGRGGCKRCKTRKTGFSNRRRPLAFIRRKIAPCKTNTSGLQKAGAAGPRPQSTVEPGHYQVERSGQMDLLLPLCVDGHLQPIRCWLDGGQAGESIAGKRVDPAKLPNPGDRSRYTDHPFRSRRPDDGQKHGAFASDLGVTKSHARPHVPDDNPFSEAQFKTMKYRPDYPDRFGCPEDVRGWARRFFSWYNFEHHHTGLALMTPATVHYGQAPKVHAHRQHVLTAAYALRYPSKIVRCKWTPSVICT